MTKYEIINPSDKCYITAASLKAAAICVCLLGEGAYALRDAKTGEQAVPMFLVSGQDEWFQAKFGHDFEAALSDTVAMEEAAKALETVEYAGKHSSLNDIKTRARNWSARIRRFLENNDE